MTLLYTQRPDSGVRDQLSESITQSEQSIESLFKWIESNRKVLKKNRWGFYPKSYLDTLKTVSSRFRPLLESLELSMEAGEHQRVNEIIDLMNMKYHLLRSTLDDIIISSEKVYDNISEEIQRVQRSTNILIYTILIGFTMGGLLFSFWQVKTISNPISNITASAKRIASGNLSRLDVIKGEGEICELSLALSEMVSRLNHSKEDLQKAYDRVDALVKIRTEKLQKKNEELIATNNDLSSFSYSVSHDLRAPLRAINGFISILTEDYAQVLDKEGIRLFGIVSDNAKKMGVLIDDILAFSRAGRLELALEKIPMTALVQSEWESLSEERENRNIEFHVDPLPDVTADVRAFKQIWLNLLSNAIKFTGKEDHALISVTGRALDGAVEYRVKDNGVGFNPEYSNKLFGLFQRLHRQDEFTGTGVGLSIVSRFLQKHKGKVEGYSTPGEGAEFILTLPDNLEELLKGDMENEQV
ncbi:MAG: ATP-binding protein [Spirochaetales bacterium]|nr:ATP-binding protein [Spirochaetales bacterium]